MKSLMVSVLLLCVAVMIQLPGQCASKPSPILIIPGLIGSRLQVLDTQPNSCSTSHKYKNLWVSPLRIFWHNVCSKKELPLVFDSNTNSFHNNTNTKIHVPGFGGTNGVEYLNTDWNDAIAYFHKMVQYFVDRDYKRGQTIRSAPYDWRLAADQLERLGYFDQLKSLIEEMYLAGGRTKVTLVVHSMGGPVSLHFFTGFSKINQAWKDKYIHAYVPIAAAWSGGVNSLPALISGVQNSLPSFLLFAKDLLNRFLVPIARSFESIPWLLPKPSVFGNAVLVSTPSKDYTANDYAQLFSDVKFTNGYRFFQQVRPINQNFPAPNVPTYCYYGTNVNTPEKYTYKKSFQNQQSTIGMDSTVKYGNGDDTVNIKSSKVCHQWSSMPSKYPFKYREFSKAKHRAILEDSRILTAIAAIVRAPPPRKKKLSWW